MTEQIETLLGLAGAPRHASAFDRSALVLIDHQMEYVSGRLPLKDIGPAIAEARSVLQTARRHRMPVFHIVHHGKPGSVLFDPQGEFVKIMPDLVPEAGEITVAKSLPNAFAGTGLHEMVRETSRSELILIGFATHMCLASTTRAALDLGYRSTIVAGATATRDLPSTIDGSVIPAGQIQMSELAALADRFAIVVANARELVERQPV